MSAGHPDNGYRSALTLAGDEPEKLSICRLALAVERDTRFFGYLARLDVSLFTIYERRSS